MKRRELSVGTFFHGINLLGNIESHLSWLTSLQFKNMANVGSTVGISLPLKLLMLKKTCLTPNVFTCSIKLLELPSIMTYCL